MQKIILILWLLLPAYLSFCQIHTKESNGIGQIKGRNKPSLKAERDKEFDKGSKIPSIIWTPATIENLTLLGKVWGFLKYYHPSIAKGDYNWDYELFRIMPKVINSKTNLEAKGVIAAWMDKLPRVEIGKYQPTYSALVKMQPDYSWITQTEVGEKIATKLNLVKRAKRESKHFYIAFDSIPNPTFNNENAYAEMAYPDTGFRLLALFRYWNIIQYFFPYKYLLDRNWNHILKEFIPKFIAASTELEYKLAVLQLIACIDDTHAVMASSETLENFKGNYYAPIEVTFIENQAVVTGYLNQELGAKTGLQMGDVLEAINDKDISTIIKEKLPYTPASNYTTKLREIAWDLLRTNDSLMIIRYRRDAMIGNLTIQCMPRYLVNPYQRIFKEDTCYRMVTADIAYIYPWTIKTEYITSIMKAVATTKGLIIDLRYAVRESMYSLGDYLFSTPTNFATLTRGNLAFPGQFTFFKTMEIGKVNDKAYQGKVVILNNEQTQSSSEFTTMIFRSVPKATVIGSTTSGADGDVSRFYLPGGILTLITGLGVYYPDGRETQRIGIIPDVEIKPTIQGIKEGRDELLEKAIEVINN